MSSERLPLINTLELRGRLREIQGRAISVETQVRWKKEGIEAPAMILRELAVELVEEGLRILRAVHNDTIVAGGVQKVVEWDR